MFVRTAIASVTIANKITFNSADGSLLSYDVTLSEQERSSSCSFSIYDPGLKILNLFLTEMISVGGLIIPLGLLENNTTQQGGLGAGVTVTTSSESAPATLKDVEAKYGTSDLSGLTAD